MLQIFQRPLTHRSSHISYDPGVEPTKRDNSWLLLRIDYLWTNYFSDIVQENPVKVNFGRYSKYRLGSIRFNSKTKLSLITITGMFKKASIPIAVIDQTIAHEMCHYAHGFSSSKPRMHKYPHHGGVINKELRKRGLDCLNKSYSAWIKGYKETLT